MAKTDIVDKPRKFEIIFEDGDEGVSIWKYDLDKFPNGPISVENRYKASFLKEVEAEKKNRRKYKSLVK